MKKTASIDEAKIVAATIGIDWKNAKFTAEDFCQGMNVEFEHGSHDPETNVTNDDPVTTGKIAWAHLKEYPDYYHRLQILEKEAEAYWSQQKSS